MSPHFSCAAAILSTRPTTALMFRTRSMRRRATSGVGVMAGVGVARPPARAPDWSSPQAADRRSAATKTTARMTTYMKRAFGQKVQRAGARVRARSAAGLRYVHHDRAVIRCAKRHHRVRVRADHADAPDVI